MSERHFLPAGGKGTSDDDEEEVVAVVVLFKSDFNNEGREREGKGREERRDY